MRMKVKVSDEFDKIDRFILENTERTSYQYFKLSKWLKFISDYFKYPYYIAIIEKESKIVACFPFVFVKSRIFGNHLISGPFASHGGGVVIKEKEDKRKIIKMFLSDLKKIAKENNIKFLQVRGPEHDFIDDFLANGFKENLKDFNFFLDLNIGIDKLRANLNKKLRNRLKNAEKSGIKIEISQNNIDDFYNLYLNTMKRLGSPPHSRNYFVELSNTGKFWIYIAKYNSKVIAASTFLISLDYATWVDNVSLSEYKNFNATTLILWDFIKNTSRIKTLDLGTSREDSTHYNYKKKWNGKIVRASKLYYYFGNKEDVIDVRSKKYAFFSNIWRLFIPKFLTKYIGPLIRKGMGY